MGHTIPTLFVLLAAVPLSAAAGDSYYISLPSNTCVNDGGQGSGHILLYDTKEACCNGLTPKERRQCLKAEVPSEVYPDFEKGRCSSTTLRPATVHPACGVSASGEAKSVAARFLKASLPVSDNEFCCRNVYGGIDQGAVDRCAARRGTWSYVAGMGCVRDDPLADDPVVYATAQTAGSLSACTKTYFPQSTAFMCDDFTCPSGWTGRTYNIHCGSLASDCTKELCCRPTCSGYTCYAPRQMSDKAGKADIICPDEGCTAHRCCDSLNPLRELLPPNVGTLRYPAGFPEETITFDTSRAWVIECAAGEGIPHITVESFDGKHPAPGARLGGFAYYEDGFHLSQFEYLFTRIDVNLQYVSSTSRLFVVWIFTRGSPAAPTKGLGFAVHYKCVNGALTPRPVY